MLHFICHNTETLYSNKFKTVYKNVSLENRCGTQLLAANNLNTSFQEGIRWRVQVSLTTDATDYLCTDACQINFNFHDKRSRYNFFARKTLRRVRKLRWILNACGTHLWHLRHNSTYYDENHQDSLQRRIHAAFAVHVRSGYMCSLFILWPPFDYLSMIQKEQLKPDRVRVKDIDEIREGRNNEGKKVKNL